MGIYFSASNLHRRAGCPGSAAAEGSYAFDDKKSAASVEGDNMHAEMLRFWDESLRPIDLTGEQIRSCESAWHHYQRLAHETGFSGIPFTEVKARSSLGFSVVMDAAHVVDTRALIIDWKFGRGAVDPAESNWQLAAAVVVAAEKWGITDATVAIIQPRAEEPLTAASYGEPEIEGAREMIAKVVAEASKPDAPRIPGDHCKYCRHAANCQEGAEAVKSLVSISQNVPSLPDADLAALLNAGRAVEPIVAAAREEARNRLREGKSIPGWKLRKGNTYRTTDPQAAWQRLKDIMPKEDFWSVIDISVAQIDSFVARHFSLSAAKAKAKTAEILGEDLRSKEGEPILVKD